MKPEKEKEEHSKDEIIAILLLPLVSSGTMPLKMVE